ncbi:MAG: TIGR03936 family radical SAM-associated protein, partial [Sporomusaceae bacterium]|nr:TIGR03936 family radical SAM-associated protein [Sporomusaceae bacterium]
YTRTVERALHRAKLPMAYSEGFNPHMKFSFASALAVGTTSSGEYLDIELTKELPLRDVVAALQNALPRGISLLQGKAMKPPVRALMAVVNLAVYDIVIPSSVDLDFPWEAAQQAVEAFTKDPIVFYTKLKNKGPAKEIDLKEFIAAKPRLTREADKVILTLALHIKPTGSVKAEEVLAALIAQYGFPAEEKQALIHRQGLFILDKGQKLTPLDL